MQKEGRDWEIKLLNNARVTKLSLDYCKFIEKLAKEMVKNRRRNCCEDSTVMLSRFHGFPVILLALGSHSGRGDAQGYTIYFNLQSVPRAVLQGNPRFPRSLLGSQLEARLLIALGKRAKEVHPGCN